MATKAVHNPNQGELFTQSRFTNHLELPVDPISAAPVREVAPDTPVVTTDVIGPSVNLIDRAEQLTEVTHRFAEINRTTGLNTALETPHARRIEARYGVGIAEGIRDKANAIHARRMRDAKNDFARASGMWAMIESGTLPEDEAKQQTHEMWNGFMKRYADDNQPNRVQLRNQQRKLVKAITKPPRRQ